MTHQIYISLGSNSQDASQQIQNAIIWLKSTFCNLLISEIYNTPPLNGIGDNYLNAVALATTDLDQNQLNTILKNYESSAGRTPLSKVNGIVPIDLDIVIFDNTIIRPKDFSYDFFQRGYKSLPQPSIPPTSAAE